MFLHHALVPLLNTPQIYSLDSLQPQATFLHLTCSGLKMWNLAFVITLALSWIAYIVLLAVYRGL